MLDKFKLSTSQMILLALFVLILVVAIFGYLEFNRMDSKLERISYDLSKVKPSDIPEQHNMMEEFVEPPENFEQENVEEESVNNEEGCVEREKPNIQEQKNELFNLTESAQEFSQDIPEEQSAFSLGSIFGNQIPTEHSASKGNEKIDKIEEDSEYSGDIYSESDGYSVDDSSVEDKEEQDELVEQEQEEQHPLIEPKWTEEKLNEMNLKEIKKLCEELKISKYGNKAVLISKILKTQ